MKRFAIAVSILILLAILASCSPPPAQLTYIPHENPATTRSSPTWASLFLFYSNVFELISIKQYSNSRSTLDELENASIPDALRYLTDRFNALSEELVATLEKLELLLEEASQLLAQNKIDDAQQKLEEIAATINSARFLLQDVEVVTDTLGDEIRIFAALAGSETRRNYERFEGMLQRVKKLIDEYDQLRESLNKRRKIKAELVATEISLDASSTSVFVGDNITVSGRLTAGTKPLAEKRLSIFIDNEPLAVNTTADGSYVTEITIPYEYVSAMTLKAEYVPHNDDIDTYLASRSQPVVVNVSFYPTQLIASAPESVHPGLLITVSGEVRSTEGSLDRSVRVFLDNNSLTQKTVESEFDFQVISPPELATGEHTITVDVTPQRRYAGASRSLPINVSLIPIETELQSPLLTIIPKTIRISGKVYYGLTPIKDAGVAITFKQTTTTTRTSGDGSFTTTIELPFDLSLVGPQELTTLIKPVEPWYAPVEVKRGVFTINLTNMGMVLAAFVSLGVLGLSRVRTRAPSQQEETAISQAKPKELPSITVVEPRYEFTGIRGRILAAYISGLEVVEKVTSIPMLPHTTLTEFVNAASPHLARATGPFTELTTIAEVALYSAHEINENIVTRAELLADVIKEELHDGVV